jgi:hypothetical protein
LRNRSIESRTAVVCADATPAKIRVRSELVARVAFIL